MAQITLAGRSVATAATANHVAASIWNPHATARIAVTEIHICTTTAGAAHISIQRATTRGTPGSAVTPTLASSSQRDLVAPSATELLLAAFTVQPTLETPSLRRWNLPAAVGAGVIIVFPEGIVVPGGAGLAIATPVATAFPASDISFAYED